MPKRSTAIIIKTTSVLDKTAKRGIIHPNAAAPASLA